MDIKATVVKMEEWLQVVSDKYDEILPKVAKNEKSIAKLGNRVATLERCSVAEFRELNDELNQVERRSRQLNLEIHGVRSEQNEDLLSKVNEAASKLKVPTVTASELQAFDRLPATRDREPVILV